MGKFQLNNLQKLKLGPKVLCKMKVSYLCCTPCIMENLFTGMPNDDFTFVKTKKRGRRNLDTNQKTLIIAGSESGEDKFDKETAIR